jgi:hypothetical protein
VSLSRRVRRLAGLGLDEWRALADGVLAAVHAELGLRTRSLANVIAWAESQQPRAGRGDLAPMRLAALSAWPYRAIGVSPSCLRRSLVLTVLLRQRGEPAVCCFGVMRDGGQFRAHAWVQCGAFSLDSTAVAFERLQPASAADLSRSARWSP